MEPEFADVANGECPSLEVAYLGGDSRSGPTHRVEGLVVVGVEGRGESGASGLG